MLHDSQNIDISLSLTASSQLIGSMLLDDLPQELCERIATYSSNRLHLAEVSITQRAAVMSALQHTLELLPITDAIPRWCHIAHHLQHIRIPHPLPHPDVLKLLSGPSLRSVEIPDNLAYLRAVASAKVTRLTVRIFGGVDSRTLFACLKAMPLVELRLLCMHRPNVTDCPILHSRTHHDAVYDACPHIKTLEMNCWLWQKHEVWLVIRHLNLEELTLTSEVPEEHIKRIAAVPSVCLESRAFRMAPNIGNSVTSINGTWVGANALSKSDVFELSNCPRLERVYVDLEEGAEEGLPSVLGPSLQSLSLTWNFVRAGHGWKNAYTVSLGSICAIVAECKNLKELCLPRVRIQLEEVLDILRRTGDNLQLFEMDVGMQRECSCEWVLRILETAARHNRNLRDLRLHVRMQDHFGGIHCYRGAQAHEKSLGELLLGADRLHQFAPSLNIDVLKQLIVKLIDMPCRCNYTLN